LSNHRLLANYLLPIRCLLLALLLLCLLSIRCLLVLCLLPIRRLLVLFRLLALLLLVIRPPMFDGLVFIDPWMHRDQLGCRNRRGAETRRSC
jgi:hypothetical protein